MTDRTYNGWANYATWRVHLEMFDAMDPFDFMGGRDFDAYHLADSLRSCAEETIESGSAEGIARDYALAFISNVDWREIAQHLIDAYADEEANA